MISLRCLFRHSTEWYYVVIDGVGHKACTRCQTPYAAILADRGKALEDIDPAKVPAIVPRHAYPTPVPKPKRQRKPKPAVQGDTPKVKQGQFGKEKRA